MVADITGEIEQYQNMPYNLEVNKDIRHFLDNLDPFKGRTDKEMNDYLFALSEQVEPRNTKKPTVFVSNISVSRVVLYTFFYKQLISSEAQTSSKDV